MSRGKGIGLGAVVVLLGAGYWWVYGVDRLPPIEVMAVDLPGSPLMFSFNDEVTVREAMVFRPAEGADPSDDLAYSEGEMMWHLVPREPSEQAEGEELPEAQPRSVVRYGRGLRELRPAEGMRRRGKPLEPGVGYVFVAQLDEGRAQVEFVHAPNDG